MLSAFDNPNQPPMMSPESQSPPWWKVAQANRGGAQGPPQDARTQIAMAMMAKQLAKMGQGMGAQPVQRQDPMAMFDLYGNPRG